MGDDGLAARGDPAVVRIYEPAKEIVDGPRVPFYGLRGRRFQKTRLRLQRGEKRIAPVGHGDSPHLIDGFAVFAVRYSVMSHVPDDLRIVAPPRPGKMQPDQPIVVHGTAVRGIEEADAFETGA